MKTACFSVLIYDFFVDLMESLLSVPQKIGGIRKNIVDQLLVLIRKVKSLDFILRVSKDSDITQNIIGSLLLLWSILPSFSIVVINSLSQCSNLERLLRSRLVLNAHQDAALPLVMPNIDISHLIKVVRNNKSQDDPAVLLLCV